MGRKELIPARDSKILLSRINHFFDALRKNSVTEDMGDAGEGVEIARAVSPNSNVANFLDFTSACITDGDIYLFGGVIRDLALFGKRDFDSDVDVVVDGNISELIPRLIKLGAEVNKFGGLRLSVGGWPVDIWSADSTWAFREGILEYRGISSMLDTTITNWDSILMNWRSKRLIFGDHYFENLTQGNLDLVMAQNPNPKGMLVRVFRHIMLKGAKRISVRLHNYLHDATNRFSYSDISMYERSHYKDVCISRELFEHYRNCDYSDSPIAISDNDPNQPTQLDMYN